MNHSIFLTADNAEIFGFVLLVVHVITLYLILGLYLPYRHRIDMEMILHKIFEEFRVDRRRITRARHDKS